MSTVMSDQPTSNVAEFFSPGPGERLRAARLSMGYDLAKIASELHLTTPVVEALEADQFHEIGARVFVRGYLRNYARIVGMPVDSILRQFDEKWPDDGVTQTMVRQSPTLPADGGPSRGLAGALTWLVVLAVVVLLLVWWRGYLDGIVPETVRSADTDSVSEALPASPDAILLPDNMPALEDGSLRLPAPPSDLPTGNVEDDAARGLPLDDGALALPPPSLPASNNGATQPRASVDAQPSDRPASAAASDALSTPERPTAAAAVDRAVAPAPVAVARPADVVPAATQTRDANGGAPVVEGLQQIVMTFSAPCWVDVRDSERKFKLFGEMPQGTRKVLGGKPPYQMVIGNAKVVDISVNGKPFDVLQYAKGNVARFTLDP